MKLPERFVLTIEGKLWNVHCRSTIATGGLPALLSHLLEGKPIDPGVFAAFGLRVSAEECTDQGNDGPDDLSVGRFAENGPMRVD